MALEFLDDLLKTAKEIVLSEGGLYPLVFPIIKNKLLLPVPVFFSSDEEKIKTFFALGIYCKKRHANYIFLGLDACSRTVKKDDLNYVIKNLDTERPTFYPKNMRNNYIILQFVDFLNSRNVTHICQYKNDKQKTSFFKPRIMENMESILLETMIQGWNSVVSR